MTEYCESCGFERIRFTDGTEQCVTCVRQRAPKVIIDLTKVTDVAGTIYRRVHYDGITWTVHMGQLKPRGTA